MKQTAFSTYYKKLNLEQKQAVDTIDGPVMIIAGPGTGKTMTLTMRIANILKRTDTDPHSVLALTFTESGAKAMRERLIGIIGPAAYYVQINTFHAFCSDLIREFPEVFLISDESAPLSDLERIQLFRSILDEGDFDLLKPVNSPYFYLYELTHAIQNLKRENVTPSRLENIVEKDQKDFMEVEKKINPRTGKMYAKYSKQERELQKHTELLDIYRTYQKKLKEVHRYDFEDMINFVVAKLETDESFKLELQERYLYILVDEYQDTNTAQNEILRLLTDTWETPNIFVVGDDEQSIYRFQGASLENILYFKNLFKNATTITLKSNYRSSQTILDASRSLIKNNLVKLEEDKSLTSLVKRKGSPIQTGTFLNGPQENMFVAEEILKLLKQGVDPDEIAVLVRNNKDIDDLRDYLARADIRYEIATGKNILEDGDVKRLLTLFSVINDIKLSPGNDIDVFTVLNYEFLKLPKLDVLKLARFASQKRINLLEAILDQDIFNEINLEEPERFLTFANNINDWMQLDANTTFVRFFEKVIKESGYLEWILEDKYNVSRINTLNTLFNEVKSLNAADHTLNLSTFLQNISLMVENGIKIEEAPLESDVQAVKLLTAHKAKGLEFDYVFIIKAIDKKWGNVASREKIKLPERIVASADQREKEKNEDERRLFYVALTRARKGIYITSAQLYQHNGYERQAVPTMFLTEIEIQHLSQIDTTSFEKSIQDHISDQLTLPGSDTEELQEDEFLQSILTDFKLSVTALNTYLACSYKFKLNNILRTPRAKPIHMSYGSAIHNALEFMFNTLKKTSNYPSEERLLLHYRKALEKEILTESEIDTLYVRGKKLLSSFLEQKKGTKPTVLYTEYPFGFRKVMLGDITLTGKIDRIDLVDKEKKLAKVIDYKTGTPKTRGEIEGTTRTSDGDLLRQLQFYKLLSQLDRNFNYTVSQGEFLFLESKHGKPSKSEIYDYPDEQIEDLKTLIKDTVRKIYHLEFEKTKEYRHCQYCDYKNHCWPQGIPTNSKS